MGQFLAHEACPDCGSSDARAVYDDGSKWCWSCETYTGSGGQRRQDLGKFKDLEFSALKSRRLTEETCRRWRYGITPESLQCAEYCDKTGTRTHQKIRKPDKKFTVIGGPKLPLYGQWLWREGGRRLVVTEGELDALSVSQAQLHKWPVVSLPSGAAHAAKVFRQNLEYLESFDKVVICFDQDDPGRKAAKEAAEVLSPRKALICVLPRKDASDMLQAGEAAELVSALWDSKPYTPDGILSGPEVLSKMLQAHKDGLPVPHEGLMTKTYGIRPGEIFTVCAGTGTGKSTLAREIAVSSIEAGFTVGYIGLEESVGRTGLGLCGIALNVPAHLQQPPEEDLKSAWKQLQDRIYLYDHFGSLDSEILMGKLRYLAKGLECDLLILDHLSIVISGQAEGDERRNIDLTMTALASLVQECSVAAVVVSHLKRPDGVPHEEGRKVSLSDLRGSSSIGQLSHTVVALERDQQDAEESSLMEVRVLKCRHTGLTGSAGYLRWHQETGRLLEETPQDYEEDPFDA